MKLEPIEFNLVAGGLDSIKSQFKEIESLVERLQSKMKGISLGPSPSALQKQSKAVISEEEKNARHLAKIRENSAKLAARLAINAVKEEERVKKKAAADELRLKEANAKAAERLAKKTSRTEINEAKRVAREQERLNKESSSRRSSAVAGGVRNAFSKATNAITATAGLVGGLGGGFAIADSLSTRMSAEKEAARLEITSKGEVKKEAALRRAGEISKRTGISEDKITRGMNSLTAKSGDAKIAMKNADFLAKFAVATNVDYDKVAELAGAAISQNSELEDTEKLKQFLLKANAQGKIGEIEIEDIAKMAKVPAGSAAYSGNQTENAGMLLGLAQIGIKGTGDSASSATAVTNLSTDFNKHSKTFKQNGINVYGKDGKLRSADELLVESLVKAGGSQAKLSKMYGAQTMPLVNVLENKRAEFYKKAFDSSTGTDAERKKKADKESAKLLMEYIKEYTQASMTEKDLDKDYQTAQSTTEAKLNTAMNELRQVVADKLMPEFIKLIPVIQKAVPHVAKLLDAFISLTEWIAENPMKAAIAAMGALMLKEVGTAVAGNMISGLIEKSFVGIAGAVGPVVGAALAAALVLAVGTYIALQLDKEEKANRSKQISKHISDQAYGSSKEWLEANSQRLAQEVEEAKAKKKEVDGLKKKRANPNLSIESRAMLEKDIKTKEEEYDEIIKRANDRKKAIRKKVAKAEYNANSETNKKFLETGDEQLADLQQTSELWGTIYNVGVKKTGLEWLGFGKEWKQHNKNLDTRIMYLKGELAEAKEQEAINKAAQDLGIKSEDFKEPETKPNPNGTMNANGTMSVNVSKETAKVDVNAAIKELNGLTVALSDAKKKVTDFNESVPSSKQPNRTGSPVK